MRVFVSSTSLDLVDYRAAAIRGLRRLGHDVVAMEDFTAASSYPLQRMIDLVRRCDAIVVLVAWRYGFVPDAGGVATVRDLPAGAEAGVSSITEFEYLTAKAAGKKVLAFLLAESAPWPPTQIDGFAGNGTLEPVARFRAALGREYVVSYFTGPDELEALVGAAVTTARIGTQVLENRIDLGSPVTADQAVPDSYFGGGLLDAVRRSGRGNRVATIDIATDWWSTRLYLLAWLLEQLTDVRRLLILEGNAFVGLIPVGAVTSALAGVHPELVRFARAAHARRRTEPDVVQEAMAVVALYQSVFGPTEPDARTAEQAATLVVTRANCDRWFAGSLITTAIEVEDVKRASAVDFIRMLDFPADYVPVQVRQRTASRTRQPQVHVIDKASLSHQLARSYIYGLLDTAGLS
jgi:hypothetical protein